MRILRDYSMRLVAVFLVVLFCTNMLPKSRRAAPAQPAVAAPRQPAVAAPMQPAPSARVQPTVNKPVAPQQFVPAAQQPGSATPTKPVPARAAQPTVSKAVAPQWFVPAAGPSATNKFTQTEAYFQVPALRQLVTKEFTGFPEVVRHMDVVSRVMAKEAELRNTHWAFYHGVTNVWTVWQDTYTELFSHFNPSANVDDADFIFLRMKGQENQKAKDFLVGALKDQGLVDDNGEVKAVLLSANLTPFGNAGIAGECTWNYIMEQKSHEAPSREMYESIMDYFKLPYTHIDKLMKLVDLLKTRQQTLLQILIPKNIVDDIGYLAWSKGIPAHQASIDWVKKSGIKGKSGQSGPIRALGILKDKFKKEQEKNPLFREMLASVEEGGYSLDAYLTRLCNDPLSLHNMNQVQARLIFTDDILLNPSSGVKMFRYAATDYKVMQEYKQRLDAIIKQIVGR